MKKALFVFGMIAVMALLVIWGCSNDEESETPHGDAIIIVNIPSGALVIGMGETFVINVSVTYEGAVIDCDLSFTSSDTTVVRVNPETGALTPVGVGTATIFISGCGVSTSVIVTVASTTIDHITVTPANDTILVGDTLRFTAIAYSSTGTPIAGISFGWNSSALSVATVSARGANACCATAVAVGTSAITAGVSTTTGDIFGTGLLNVAGSGTLNGNVYNSFSMAGVSNVWVVVQGAGRNTYTDASGNFSFTRLTAGTYNLDISASNFEPATWSVRIGNDSTTTVSIPLDPVPTIIEGYVKDAGSRIGINDAQVLIIETGQICTTYTDTIGEHDSTGYFRFQVISGGDYTLRATKTGFTMATIPAHVYEGTTENVEIDFPSYTGTYIRAPWNLSHRTSTAGENITYPLFEPNAVNIRIHLVWLSEDYVGISSQVDRLAFFDGRDEHLILDWSYTPWPYGTIIYEDTISTFLNTNNININWRADVAGSYGFEIDWYEYYR